MQAEDPERYDLDALCERAGVTARTVRYYIQIGLLPSPGMGAGIRYARSHLDRLRFIRLLQARHLPLHEIAKQLEALDDAGIADALAASVREGGATSSAAEYLRALLADGAAGKAADGQRPPRPGTKSRPRGVLADPADADSAGWRRREHWEHIALTQDVVLQVRRPLSRETNRRIERLLAAARRILDDQS